jgi:CRISPR system Cascade subunit CasA
MTSLLTLEWLPVRRADGCVEWITPYQLGDPDIVGFAAHRADFNGALAQFAIGLLQTISPADSEGQWRKRFKAPPSSEELAEWFGPLTAAFTLDGDGVRFMQDLGLDGGAECGIDALLVDAAGGSAVDKNTDLFVKRDTVKAMCPHCAALALFTLQTNAPAGGAGHRTGLRGGGPLTTLVVASPTRSLWHDLWLNVLPQNAFLARSGDAEKTAPFFTFPWLAETGVIQAAGAETQPLQVHPHHVFWAMPRRIRLDFDDVRAGQCDICKRDSAQLVRRYVTKPQGLNYKGPWRHPFSPYYETKEGWLPVHPQPGGFSYRHWLSWATGSASSKKKVEAAATVSHVAREERQDDEALRLWVFGFDLDNAKARCWYETTFPLYDCRPDQQTVFKELVGVMIEAAEQSVFYLRQAVKQAWFGDSDVRGDLSFVDKMFWDGTDEAFYRQLRALIAQAATEQGLGGVNGEFALANAGAWHEVLSKTARRLFDADIVGAGAIVQQDPRRIAQAYQGLRRNLDGKALKAILHLPLPVADNGGEAGKRKAASITEASIS